MVTVMTYPFNMFMEFKTRIANQLSEATDCLCCLFLWAECETYELTPIYKTTIKSSEIKSTDIPPLVIISCNDKRGTVQYGLQYTVYITIQLYTGGEFSLVSACLL